MVKYLNLPAFLLFVFLARLTYFGAGFAEAIVIIALSSLYAIDRYIKYKKEPEANKDLKDKMAAIEAQHKLLQDKVGAIGFNALRK